MTTSIAMRTLTPAAPSTLARASSPHATDGALARAGKPDDAVQAPEASTDAGLQAGAASPSLQPRAASGEDRTEASAFADVIASVSGDDAPQALPAAGSRTADDDEVQDADPATDASSAAFGALATSPAMQAALGRVTFAANGSQAGDGMDGDEHGVDAVDARPVPARGAAQGATSPLPVAQGDDAGAQAVAAAAVDAQSRTPAGPAGSTASGADAALRDGQDGAKDIAAAPQSKAATAPTQAPTPTPANIAHARLHDPMDVSNDSARSRTRAEDAPASPSAASGPASVAAAGLVMPNASVAGRAADAGILVLNGAEPSQWRPALKAALGERLQVQVGARSEQAVIRLDPPSLGRIEIVIRHEGGHLQVHLAASNGDVLRQLQAVTDGLQKDLVHRHHGEVAVTVSELARDNGGDARRERAAQDEPERTPGRALQDTDADGREAFAHLQERE